MTLDQNSIPQLWNKVNTEVRDVICLMETPLHPDDERNRTTKILTKLRNANAAVQEIERRQIGRGAGQCF